MNILTLKTWTVHVVWVSASYNVSVFYNSVLVLISFDGKLMVLVINFNNGTRPASRGEWPFYLKKPVVPVCVLGASCSNDECSS